jgi:hypothetical protein
MTLPVALTEKINLVSSIVVGLDFLHTIECRTGVRLGIKQGDYRTFSYEKGVNANHHLAANFVVRREISTAFRRLLFMCYILNMHAVTQNTSDEFNDIRGSVEKA